VQRPAFLPGRTVGVSARQTAVLACNLANLAILVDLVLLLVIIRIIVKTAQQSRPVSALGIQQSDARRPPYIFRRCIG
jgi:hypothetical protein